MRRAVEWVFMVAAALVLSGALWRLFGGGSSVTNDGDSRIEVVLVIIYSAVAILAVAEFRRTVGILWRNPALVALLALACLSSLWSDSPDLVFRRTLGMGGATLFGVVLASRYSFDEQLKVLRWAFRIAAAGTLAVIMASPSRAHMPDGDMGIRGVFTHKNGLGAAMALAFLVEWYLRDASLSAKALKWLSLSAFAGLLVISNSMTSAVTLVATLGGVWMIRALCVRRGVPLSAVAVFAAIAVLAVTAIGIGPGDLMGVVGRSPDITGRTELWSGVVDAIQQKPLLGYGFSGFWRGATAGSDAIAGQLQWAPMYSHNGYLEISLSLGLVGLSLAILLLAVGFKRAWAACSSGDSPLDYWPLALLMFIAIHNLAECSIAWQNCLEWSACIATIAGCDPWVRTMFDPPEEIEDPLPDAAEELIA